MTYWEALGLPGTAASPQVEAASRWVQWALYGVMSGVSGVTSYVDTSSALDPLNMSVSGASQDTESVIRYNLQQFWSYKAACYALADESSKRQFDRLDVIANGILNAVDTGLMYSASPSYWDYWKAFLFGGTPSRPSTVADADEAKQAALDASAAASRAGLPTMASYFQNEAALVDTRVTDSNAFWSQAGLANVGGIPWWAWLAILGIGGYLVWKAAK